MFFLTFFTDFSSYTLDRLMMFVFVFTIFYIKCESSLKLTKKKMKGVGLQI